MRSRHPTHLCHHRTCHPSHSCYHSPCHVLCYAVYHAIYQTISHALWQPQALSSISSGSNTCLAIVNTIARAVAIVIVTVAALGKAVVRHSCHPCHLSFSFHPCHLPHFRYLVIRVILVIPVIVVTLSLSVMSTATVDADLDLKAALTIVHDIGWPRPTCEDPEWFLERGLQQDIPIILFTKGLGLGHEGASFFVATKRSSAAICIGRDGHDHPSRCCSVPCCPKYPAHVPTHHLSRKH